VNISFRGLIFVPFIDQLTDGGPLLIPGLPSGSAGPPFGAAGSAFPFLELAMLREAAPEPPKTQSTEKGTHQSQNGMPTNTPAKIRTVESKPRPTKINVPPMAPAAASGRKNLVVFLTHLSQALITPFIRWPKDEHQRLGANNVRHGNKA
jgi:hypothetical protein